MLNNNNTRKVDPKLGGKKINRNKFKNGDSNRQ